MTTRRKGSDGKFLAVPLTERFWAFVDKSGPTAPNMDSECWMWTGRKYRNGYGSVYINHDGGKKRDALAHRVSWRMANGDIPAGAVVMHACDVRACVRPSHLCAGSQRENIHDMIAKGRAASPDAIARRGDENGAAKLTSEKVAEIRRLYEPRKYTQTRIAKEYDVSLALVEKIVGGRLWKYSDAGYVEGMPS